MRFVSLRETLISFFGGFASHPHTKRNNWDACHRPDNEIICLLEEEKLRFKVARKRT
jgi:hypothetical protein